uniref:MD-2-related lipid-recognition domain-containing protein n=1 Tax=Heliothis virescens TaxID=7102 RepID=A0A2A4JDD2_HELVI
MTTLATAYLTTILGTVPIPYGLGENAVTCNFLTNTYCPVVGGEVIQYTLNMYIESFFPVDTQAAIEFRIVDDSNSPVMCIRVPIRIAAPLTFSERNSTLTV